MRPLLGQSIKEIQGYSECNSCKQSLGAMVFKNYQNSVRYLYLSLLFSMLSTLIQISIHCSQICALTSDGISISDSVTRHFFTMTSFRFTTFYSLSLAVSSRYLVIKCGYLVVLHIITSIPNREVSNNRAFTGSFFNALSAIWLAWMTDSLSHNTSDSHSSPGLGAPSISGSRPSGPAGYCNYFQCVRPFLSEKTISLPKDSPLILLSLTE